MSFRLPTPVLLVLLGLAIATLGGLGVWQLQRAAWRAELVAARNARLAGPPLATAQARALRPDELEYRLVALEGVWDADHVMILANRARAGVKGEHAVQPLVIAPGEAVLVDRGWYPVAQREAVIARLRGERAASTSGLARYVEGLRAAQTPAGTWTALAPGDMAAGGGAAGGGAAGSGTVGLPYRVAPWYLVEGPLLAEGARPPAAYPASGFLPYSSTTPHIEYALTWFGIAAALAAIAVARFIVAPRRARRRGRAGA